MIETHVKIAEVKIGGEGIMLRSCLGSCVGVVFIWKEKKICGMAHCFLPATETEGNVLGAKYVNQGINSLINLMKIHQTDISEIEVYVAGGANMINQLVKNKNSQIGKNNAEAAEKYLAERGFKIKRSDLGKDTGIKIYVNCSSFEVEFIRLEPLNLSVWKAG